MPLPPGRSRQAAFDATHRSCGWNDRSPAETPAPTQAGRFRRSPVRVPWRFPALDGGRPPTGHHGRRIAWSRAAPSGRVPFAVDVQRRQASAERDSGRHRRAPGRLRTGMSEARGIRGGSRGFRGPRGGGKHRSPSCGAALARRPIPVPLGRRSGSRVECRTGNEYPATCLAGHPSLPVRGKSIRPSEAVPNPR